MSEQSESLESIRSELSLMLEDLMYWDTCPDDYKARIPRLIGILNTQAPTVQPVVASCSCPFCDSPIIATELQEGWAGRCGYCQSEGPSVSSEELALHVFANPPHFVSLSFPAKRNGKDHS